MVRVPSVFSQLLRFFPRSEFSRLVVKHGAEKAAKGFSCWTQFIAMLFCQLAHADSLRAICLGLSLALGRLRHLGIVSPPNKSTLSYANAHRPAALFEDIFWNALGRFRQQGGLGPRRGKFRFKNKLLSLDSTTISLCLNLFPWAKFRRCKGGVKAHVLLDHDDYMPAWLLITEAKAADIKAARLLRLNKGSIVAMDRAYVDFALFRQWTDAGVFFVTRLKEGILYEVVEDRPIPAHRNILADQVIRLTGHKAEKECPHLLRRVVVWDEKKCEEIEFLTNNFELGASTIAAIYKDRWQIEIFFKTLKQNLKVKTFVGTTENALRIQIWTALIALLLLRWLQHLSQAGWSLPLVSAMLSWNLFVHRELRQWLNDPLLWAEEPPPIDQLFLPLPGIGQAPLERRG